MGQDLLLRDRVVDVPRRLDAVEGEVGEEPLKHLLLEVELEGLPFQLMTLRGSM